MASAFLVKALLPLMSAKTSHAMDDSPNKNEAIAAPYTDRRPTRWVVLSSRSKMLRPLQLSGAARPPASPAAGRQRIHHQPCDGQGAHAAGNGRDSAGHLNGFAETHIAAEYVALLPQLGKLAGFGGKNAFTE